MQDAQTHTGTFHGTPSLPPPAREGKQAPPPPHTPVRQQRERGGLLLDEQDVAVRVEPLEAVRVAYQQVLVQHLGLVKVLRMRSHACGETWVGMHEASTAAPPSARVTLGPAPTVPAAAPSRTDPGSRSGPAPQVHTPEGMQLRQSHSAYRCLPFLLDTGGPGPFRCCEMHRHILSAHLQVVVRLGDHGLNGERLGEELRPRGRAAHDTAPSVRHPCSQASARAWVCRGPPPCSRARDAAGG